MIGMTRLEAMAVLTASLTACSTTANITLRDGSSLEAEIVDSDPNFLHVESDDYGPGVVDRRMVDDIDHPGNVAATLGTIAVGAGTIVTLMGVVLAADCGGQMCGFIHLFTTIPGAVTAGLGLPPMIWGFAVWGSSVSAADGSDPPRLRHDPHASEGPHAEIPPMGLSVAF
jgi:hypothetical protein